MCFHKNVVETETGEITTSSEKLTQISGFRVSINFDKFFDDERRLMFFWLNAGHRQTINKFTQRICKILNITRPTGIIANGHFLPPSEDTRIIQPGDTLQFVPFYFDMPTDVDFEQVENTVSDIPVNSMDKDQCLSPSMSETVEKESKKKKRKKQKEVANESIQSIENEEKKVIAPENDKSQTEMLEVVLSTVKKFQDLHGKNQRDEESDGDSKLKNSTSKDHININGVTDGRITKRKRVRVRKNKKNKQIEVNNISDDESCCSQSSAFAPVNSKNSHLRFSDEVSVVTPTILRNSNSIKDKPRIIHAMNLESGHKANVNPSSQVINISENSTTEDFSKLSNTNPLDEIMKDVHQYPLYNEQHPKENDIVLFKMLKMDENYSPIVSNPIVGKVLKFNVPDLTANILLIKGHEECSFPNGKFDLDNDEDHENQPIENLNISWNQLIEPRIINKHFSF